MRKNLSKIMPRALLIPAIVLALCVLPACNEDSDSGSNNANNSSNSANNQGSNNQGSNNQGNDETSGLSVTYNGQTMGTNTTMSATNTFVFEDNAQMMTTIIGGWANPEMDPTFGTITAKLAITDTVGQPIGAGAYTFNEDESAAKSARLTLSDAELGLPANLVAESGTLTITSLAMSGNSLDVLELTFDGTFKNSEGSDTEEYKLTGAVKYKK